jgi:hypothetical protein
MVYNKISIITQIFLLKTKNPFFNNYKSFKIKNKISIKIKCKFLFNHIFILKNFILKAYIF